MSDPKLFSDESIPPEIQALNKKILQQVIGTPTYRELGAVQMRELRKSEFRHGDSSRIQDVTIPGEPTVGGRIFFPMDRTKIAGALLHLHGGGFVFGSAYGQNDLRLLRHADKCGLAIVSVDYRLSPEHVFPAALNDCIAAAKWLTSPEGRSIVQIDSESPLMLVGESAGGNLAVSMLAKLPRPSMFAAACLVYGWYDMSGLPFFQQSIDTRLVMSGDDLRWFREQYLGEESCASMTIEKLKDPEISPLYADVSKLPEALFIIGTKDALLDDSLFMHARWISSGNNAHLRVYPGAAHGVGHFGPHQHTAQGETVLCEIEAFYKRFLK